MKLKNRPRLTATLLAVAAAFVALAFTWFQGFEIDTSNWFADGQAVVNRVLGTTVTPSTSTSFNGSPTSVYANNITAASGDFLGRVTSAVKSGTCVVDTSGAIGPSLLCFGPYTDFNLKPAFHAVGSFPSGGYTDQIDIYLDNTYATSHQDCAGGTAPCTPTTSTVNTACVPSDLSVCTQEGTSSLWDCPDPGLACEGSRFTWTVGINAPDGQAFHRDYVFQVGTLAAGQVAGCPDGGYSINGQYNSFRSGGSPYFGFETKCINAPAGWYTFKQVFSNDNGFLHVDWSITDKSTKSTHVCHDPSDTTGAVIDCTWSRTSQADPIDQIGCPRYGWLANEEINDLPIDNTQFATFGGECGQPTERAQITPTNTTCQQFRDSTAPTLDALQYTLKGGNINSVSPGVFFYYTTVTGTKNDPVGISQDPANPPGSISITKSQAIIYSSTTCTKAGSLTVNPDGTADGKLPSTGSFIIGVKYDPTSLKGKKPPTSADGTGTYTFDTEHPTGTQVVTAQIELEPKPK